MKRLLPILVLALLVVPAGAFNVSVEDRSTSWIKWNWTAPGNISGINVDGKLVTTFDPQGTYLILGNLNPDEPHQITVYATGDTGTNTTSTLPDNGDVPLGIWIYGIPALLCLLVARYAKIAVVNVLTVIFSLFGIWQLVRVKDLMTAELWTLCLIVYSALVFIGFVAWAFQTGRWR